MFSWRLIHGMILAVAACALPTSPLLGQGTAPKAAAVPPNPDNDRIIVEGQKEKKVCKIFDAPTGSRVGERRVCLKESEWRQAEAAAQRSLDRENQRTEALKAQLEDNGRNGFAKPVPR